MVIQHNIPAINSHRNLLINNNATAKNLEKLSSGYRINRAGDDAAGLAISEKMRGQIRGLAKAEDNASHAINLIQTAEGGLQETHAILQRMRELAVQASNGTYQDDDRANISLEVTALKEEIDRISTATEYNGMKLLNGAFRVGSVEGTVGFSKPSSTTAADYFTAAPLGTGTDPGATVKGTITISIDAAGVVTAAGTNITQLSGNNYKYSSGTEEFTFTIDDGMFSNKDGGIGRVVINYEFVSDGGSGTVNLTSATAERTIVERGNLSFQIGANGTADQRMNINIENMGSAYLGDGTDFISDIDISTRAKANLAIDIIDAAIDQVSGQRAELGAAQNRLEHTLNNLGVTKENLTAAESTIRDVDMAKEMMEFTKNSILVQASQAMLAQANALPQGVLSLLG